MARFALFTNGVKVETLDDLRENYNISDMLQNFESKKLHRWLAGNCLLEELTKVEQIKANVSDEVNSVLMDILGVPENVKQEFLKKKQQEQKQRENAQNYLDSIARLKKLSFELQQARISDDKIDALISLSVPSTEFINGLEHIPQRKFIVSKIKELAQTNTSAKVKLGALYAKGIDVEKNDDLAFIFYEQAAELGDSYGMSCLALCYRDGKGCSKDLARYIELLNKSADLGNPVAMTNLGNAYSSGCGVEKSYDKANELYIQASNIGGYALAYANLGVSYEHGYGFEKDLVKAFQFYKIAAEAGNCFAQRNMGRCYQYGYGIEIDMLQAYHWYSKAAESGDSVAQYKIGWFFEEGKGNVEKNAAKAFEWYQKSANQNDAEGQACLADCYYYGIGVEHNYEKAAKLYEQAIAKGPNWAKRRLGFLYQYGQGVEKDIRKAIELYTVAADRSDDLSMKYLGDIFFEVEDELFDTEKALMWYKKAVEAGNEKAILKKFEILFYNSLYEYGFDFLNIEALNTLLDAYNKKVPGAESFICFFKYMQYTFKKNSLQQDEEFERIMEFFTENCFDFDDSIDAWFSALLSEAANDVEPALLVLGMLIINAEEGEEDLSRLLGAAFDKNDAKDFLEKAANRNYRLAKKLLKDMEEDMEL